MQLPVRRETFQQHRQWRPNKNTNNGTRALILTWVPIIRSKKESLQVLSRLLAVLVKVNRATGNYAAAFQLSDCMNLVKDNLRHLIDVKIVNRAVEILPDLLPAETQLLILTKLNLTNREMAQMLGVSIKAIRKARYRIRKKFDVEEEAGLEVSIQDI